MPCKEIIECQQGLDNIFLNFFIMQMIFLLFRWLCVFVLVLFQCFAVLGNSFISKPSPEECQLTLYTGRQVKNTFFTTFLCTKLNKLCICDIVISNICLILHSYDKHVSCCKYNVETGSTIVNLNITNHSVHDICTHMYTVQCTIHWIVLPLKK